MKRQSLNVFGVNVFNVALIVLTHDYLLDSGAFCGKNFLLDAADGEHFSAQGHLAGHGYVFAHGSAGEGGDYGRGHGDSGGGTILGDGWFTVDNY